MTKSDMQLSRETFGKITANIETVIRGQRSAIRKLLAAVVSGGHVLLEDYPGTGKPGWNTAEEVERHIARLERALQAGLAPKSGKILDLGCGAGDFAIWFSKKGYDVYGIDISPTAIEWAREKAAAAKVKAAFQVGNVVDLEGYADSSFDFVLDSHCLHCIVGDDRKKFLGNAHRVLKPGGYLLVATMCGDVTHDLGTQRFDPVSRLVIRSDGVATRYIGRPEDIVAEIASAGFDVLQWEVLSAKLGSGQRDVRAECERVTVNEGVRFSFEAGRTRC